MKFRVYVRRTKAGCLGASIEAADVQFVQDVYEEMTSEGKEQAMDFLLTIESAALNYVELRNYVLLPSTVLVELTAIGVITTQEKQCLPDLKS
jgi:hypothetical protein